MKKAALAALVIVVAAAATAEARVNFNVNIDVPVGGPVPVVTAPPAPVVTYPAPVVTRYPAPVAYPQQVVYPSDPPPAVLDDVEMADSPSFIYSPNLGFYVSVGLPYDVAYIDNGYYLNRGGYWYYGPSYGGPWSYVQARRLPRELHRHRYEQVRYYRDYEYRHFMRDRDHYRGRWYRPVARGGYEHRHDGRWDGRGQDRGEHRGDWRR